MSVEIKQKSKLLGRFLGQNSEKSCTKIHEKSRQNFFDLAPEFFGNGALSGKNMRHVFRHRTPSFFAAETVGHSLRLSLFRMMVALYHIFRVIILPYLLLHVPVTVSTT